MNDKLFIVDSFTNCPFKGNPAGVCLIREAIDASRMQAIATELGFSETAFVHLREGVEHHDIRYFSPKMEIPLCGHATLASAKILFARGSKTKLKFVTVNGVELFVRKASEFLEMQFPIFDLAPAKAPDALLSALGITEVLYVGSNPETNILMLEISNPEELKNLAPDFPALVKSHDSIHGVSVTAAANDQFDFHSRFFWPWSGGEEDPVTGGTHTFLAKYWSDKLDKTILKSFQSSARTGEMEVEITTANELLIRGQAVIVMEGQLRI